MKCYPFSCELNITNHCNLNCYFCSMECSGESDFEWYKDDNLEKIITQLKRSKCVYISISGGEPLTHPNFYNIVRKLTNSGFIVTMATNGILIDDISIVKIKQAGIKWIQISMHSITDETCKKIMGAPVQSKILNAIDVVSKTEAIGLSVCVVKNQYNYSEIDEISKYLVDRNIPILYRDELAVGKLKEKEYFQCQGLPTDGRDILQNYITSRDSENNKIRKFAIMTNGDIVPCTELGVIIGNIFTDDLLDVWEKNRVIGLCKGCGETPCLANFYHHNLDIRQKVDIINNESKQTYNINQ